MVAKARSNGLVVKFQKSLMVALAALVLIGSLPLHQAEAAGHDGRGTPMATGRARAGRGSPMTTGGAYAWQYGVVSGTIGAFWLPTICVGQLTFGFTVFGCDNKGPIVYRSPASTGSQVVNAIYVIERWDGSTWSVITKSVLPAGQIAATQTYYTFAAPYMLPNLAGYLRFTWYFDWRVTNGPLLGNTLVISSLASDYKCQIRLCVSSPTYFWATK